MKHLINQLRCELFCSEEQQAFECRTEAARLLPQRVSETMDRVCLAYAGEDSWIIIERLEIDLGNLDSTSFSVELNTALAVQMEKQLAAALGQIAVAAGPPAREVFPIEIVQYILLNGTIPWWATAQAVDLNILFADVLLQEGETFSRWLLQNQLATSLWQRISYQLNEGNLGRLILLLPTLAMASEALVNWVSEVRKKTGLLITDPGPAGILMKRIIAANAPVLFRRPELLPFYSMTDSYWPVLFPGAEYDKIAAVAASGETEATNGSVLPADTTVQDVPLPKAERPEKYPVNESGIVLLSPFFKPFFEAVGLLDGNEWKDKESAFRAVHLLKYLSTGLANPAEHTLVLEKILCGLAIAEPVPMELALTEKEMEEAAILLSSVISHWISLKNTSVKGLQESFLKRDGILSRRDKDWLLQVERKTMDVLLDNIPWGYTQIFLPWNPYLITVEW